MDREGFNRLGRRSAALTALLLCGAPCPSPAWADTPDPAAFLDTAERLRNKDHAKFAEMLSQIHGETHLLNDAQRWHLRYLDAWEDSFEGNYEKAREPLKDISEHSGDITLSAKASALLMNNESINNRYDQAFTIANQLATELPRIHDKTARFTVLMNLSQTLNAAGQTDLAIQYARMMADTIPPGETLCRSYVMETGALYNARSLNSSSKLLEQAIRICSESGNPVASNTQKLLKGMLLLDEKQPGQALALLDPLAESIQQNHYYAHELYWQVERAQAYEQLGRDDEALRAAEIVVRTGKSSDISEVMRNAYAVLYRIEKKRKNLAAALRDFENFTVQDKQYLDEVGARALAYQKVQQQVLTKKLETEELSKQNSILRLQRALDTKAAETSRLYITLLLLTLAFIIAWLFRLKRSQLRFKRMSFHDGLTGIYNHQHFIGEAERLLRTLEKKQGPACLISIDLDHFKHINDTYGHAMGDAVLKRTVMTCQEQLQPGDLFGRLGGEEFGVLLPECPRAKGMEVANRLLVAVGATPIEKDGILVSVSASVGLAFTDSTGYELQRLCKEADDALYRAKRGGRNRIVAEAEDPGMVDA